MVFDSVSYKAVISNGLVLDKNGNKMSKKLGNAVNPFDNIERFGSDSVRWYMIENSQPWDNIKYDEAGVEEVSRKLFATLYNTYKFFALYANVDGFVGNEPEVPLTERPEIDRWILSLLNTLIKDVTEALEDYEPTKAARAIEEFVNDNLSNWYVRLNRKRFWAGKMDQSKLAAYQTLATCLKSVALMMAPFSPFYSDKLYNDMCAPVNAEYSSVHLAMFPKADETAIDKALETRMSLAQIITSNVLALRRKVNIKVRQPLQTLLVPAVDEQQKLAVEAVKDIVASEVNVKTVNVLSPEESNLVKMVKADFKKLGPRYGKVMKLLAKAISEMSQEAIAELERNGSYTFAEVEGAPVVTTDDVEIIPEDVPGWLVANEGNVTVALDVTVTEELRNEGLARELINRIQNIRKSQNFDITDKVNILLTSNEQTDAAVDAFKDYIAGQVLASNIAVVSEITNNPVPLEIDDIKIDISVEKA
jgi:isoleucyl-tRNA synthetase